MAIFSSIFTKLSELVLQYPKTTLVIVLVIYLLRYVAVRENVFKKNGIPHEKPSYLFGNMMQPTFGTVSFVERLQNHYSMDTISRYMGFYDFNNPVIIIRSPALVRVITQQSFTHFTDHHGCIDSIQDLLFRNNLFSLSNSKDWLKKHHYLTQALCPTNLKAMFGLITQCGKNFNDYIDQKTDNRTITIDSKDIFSRYTIDVIASYAFGIDIDSLKNPNNAFYIMVRKALTFKGFKLFKYFVMRMFPSLFEYVNITGEEERNFFTELVRDSMILREKGVMGRPDLIQLLMEVRKRPNVDESNMTVEDIVSLAFGFYVSGFESTSTLMCYVAHLLSINPNEQEKLQKEVDEVYKKFKDQPTFEAINEMKYLEAVINETLRMYPMTPYVERVCTRRVALSPSIPGAKHLIIGPGTSVWIPTYAMQNDLKYFPWAKRFWPERFIKNHKKIISSFTFLPFGHGPRMCLGKNFALLITKVLVYFLLAKSRVKRSEKMSLPLELSTTSFSMVPKGGFSVDLEPRWYKKIN